MGYYRLSELVVFVHFLVVIFVVAGGLLVVARRWVAWVHLPIIAWVIFAELFHRVCPLTFLENWLRHRAGVPEYQGDFVARYIVPVLYPNGLTARMQVVFGISVFLINVVLYGFAFGRRKAEAPEPSPATHA